MLSYNDMVKCGYKYTLEKKKMLIEKYKAFIDYLKKVVDITFEDNKEQIASYLKETRDQSFLLEWRIICDIHYDGFTISITKDEMLNVDSLIAHDTHDDSILNVESDIDNEALLSFFDREYKKFVDLFVPNYYLEQCKDRLVNKEHSLICKIADKFNEECFKHFQHYLSSLGIDNVYSFNSSKFSLSFTDEKRSELDKEVFDLYNSYREKVVELTKKFDESVKDLK